MHGPINIRKEVYYLQSRRGREDEDSEFPVRSVHFPSDYSESLLGRLQCLDEVCVVQRGVPNLDARCQHLGYWKNKNLADDLGVWLCCIYVSVCHVLCYVTAFKVK